jgi:hypothetical protein
MKKLLTIIITIFTFSTNAQNKNDNVLFQESDEKIIVNQLKTEKNKCLSIMPNKCS